VAACASPGLTIEDARLLFQRLVENQIDPTFSSRFPIQFARVSIGCCVAARLLPVTLTTAVIWKRTLAAAGGITVEIRTMPSIPSVPRWHACTQIPLSAGSIQRQPDQDAPAARAMRFSLTTAYETGRAQDILPLKKLGSSRQAARALLPLQEAGSLRCRYVVQH